MSGSSFYVPDVPEVPGQVRYCSRRGFVAHKARLPPDEKVTLSSELGPSPFLLALADHRRQSSSTDTCRGLACERSPTLRVSRFELYPETHRIFVIPVCETPRDT